ncbi:hypothetical protein GCM10017161_02560 [Thalassotalea marina]|uniref:Uncharacterized protein n=1 Tax=Thalassotalea marina TaxID=1673741 RepID=A0A919BBW2_9GAMM|nr:hypothetical protein GCM10017161_02560 [Thalassotalea marina]
MPSNTNNVNNIEIGYSFFVGSEDILPLLINFIVFSALIYPFNKFITWLCSGLTTDKHNLYKK